MKKYNGITQRGLADQDLLISSSELAHMFNSQTSDINAILRFMGFVAEIYRIMGTGAKACFWPRFAAIEKIKQLIELRDADKQRYTAQITQFADEVEKTSNILRACLTQCEFFVFEGTVMIRTANHAAHDRLATADGMRKLTAAAKRAFFFNVKLFLTTERPMKT